MELPAGCPYSTVVRLTVWLLLLAPPSTYTVGRELAAVGGKTAIPCAPRAVVRLPEVVKAPSAGPVPPANWAEKTFEVAAPAPVPLKPPTLQIAPLATNAVWAKTGAGRLLMFWIQLPRLPSALMGAHQTSLWPLPPALLPVVEPPSRYR